MDVVRCKESFSAGPSGAGVGSLFPADHELVKRFAKFFEPVTDYVARQFPEHASKPAPVEEKPATKKIASRKPSAATNK